MTRLCRRAGGRLQQDISSDLLSVLVCWTCTLFVSAYLHSLRPHYKVPHTGPPSTTQIGRHDLPAPKGTHRQTASGVSQRGIPQQAPPPHEVAKQLLWPTSHRLLSAPVAHFASSTATQGDASLAFAPRKARKLAGSSSPAVPAEDWLNACKKSSRQALRPLSKL